MSLKAMAKAARTLTPALRAEFASYRPARPVRLYRWEDAPHVACVKVLRSYTYEKGMVRFMRETEAQEGRSGQIIEEVVPPDRIVVDFTRLPDRYRGEFLNEVIVSWEPWR